MADDATRTGNADRLRVNTSQPRELRDGSRKFGVSEDMFAVVQVGSVAADVERYPEDKAQH